mgnify:CR=1 FL=1
MTAAVDIISWVLLSGGAIFCLIGAIGLHRMPGFYERVHAAGLIDTLGAGLILLGLALQAGVSLVAVKLILILVFAWITSPASTHALVKAAYARKVRSEAPALTVSAAVEPGVEPGVEGEGD